MIRKESMDIMLTESTDDQMEKKLLDNLATEKMPNFNNVNLSLVREFLDYFKKKTLSDASMLETSNPKEHTVEYRFTFTSKY